MYSLAYRGLQEHFSTNKKLKTLDKEQSKVTPLANSSFQIKLPVD